MSSNSSVSFESSNVFTNLAQLIQKPLISSVSAEIIRGVLASSIKIESASSIIANHIFHYKQLNLDALPNDPLSNQNQPQNL